MNLSLEKILSILVSKAAKSAKDIPLESDVKPTSIRFKPETKRFLQAQAEALNTSVNAIVETILDGVVENTTSPINAQLRTMRERFFHLFDAHHVDLPRMVSLLTPYGFTTSAVNNPDSLHDLLTFVTLKSIAGIFSVQPEWLSGSSDIPIQDEVTWYKSLHDAYRKIDHYRKTDRAPNVMFITRERPNFEEAKIKADNVESLPIGIVIKLKHSNADGVTVETFEKWQFERWNYEKCRIHYKCLALYCERKGIPAYGYTLTRNEIHRLRNNEILPVTVLSRARPTWNPEDYVTDHKNIAKDVDEYPDVIKFYREPIN